MCVCVCVCWGGGGVHPSVVAVETISKSFLTNGAMREPPLPRGGRGMGGRDESCGRFARCIAEAGAPRGLTPPRGTPPIGERDAARCGSCEWPPPGV